MTYEFYKYNLFKRIVLKLKNLLKNILKETINLFKNIYTSMKNLLTFRRPRCTHLGCALIYNKEEEIYECPCHGSIYNKEGKVINGPARKDINV